MIGDRRIVSNTYYVGKGAINILLSNNEHIYGEIDVDCEIKANRDRKGIKHDL